MIKPTAALLLGLALLLCTLLVDQPETSYLRSYSYGYETRELKRGGGGRSRSSRSSSSRSSYSSSRSATIGYYSSTYSSAWYVPIAYRTYYGYAYYGNSEYGECLPTEKTCINEYKERKLSTTIAVNVDNCCCVCIPIVLYFRGQFKRLAEMQPVTHDQEVESDNALDN